MLFKNITVLNENLEPEYGRYVGIKEDRIVYIGKERPEGLWRREYDGKGKLLMSGFYNAHGHSPMTLMRGYGENLVLQDWLNKKIFPFEARLDGEAVYWATMLAMAESFRFGIVSTSDMYYFCDDMARAYIDSGAKGNISRSIANVGGEAPDRLESLKEAKTFYDEFHGEAGGRIKVDASLHAEYTSNFETARALADYAVSKNMLMQVHVSETRREHDECVERHGLTPAAYLEKAGIFDVPAVAAHCVYSTEEDWDIFKNKNVTVAANPVSNMKLASGICNVSGMLEKGVNVAIGTDSVASNNSLDFIEEMKVLAIGNKVSVQDPTAISPKEVLRAATLGGAAAQGRKDCGVLKEGNKADLIVLNLDSPNMRPVHSIVNNLVYSCCSGDIIMTVVDGKVVYENGNYCTIDIEKVAAQAEKSANKILERL